MPAMTHRGWKLKLTSVNQYSSADSSNYSLYFLSSCWLCILHNCSRMLFHSLFHWHGCGIQYSWFSKHKYLSVSFFLFNPVIHYTLFSFSPRYWFRLQLWIHWYLLWRRIRWGRACATFCVICCKIVKFHLNLRIQTNLIQMVLLEAGGLLNQNTKSRSADSLHA